IWVGRTVGEVACPILVPIFNIVSFRKLCGLSFSVFLKLRFDRVDLARVTQGAVLWDGYDLARASLLQAFALPLVVLNYLTIFFIERAVQYLGDRSEMLFALGPVALFLSKIS